MSTVITSGKAFVDIDALACAVAYRDFLNAKGIVCEIVFPGEINETVSETIKNWELDIKKETLNITQGTKFVVVDCSNPNVVPEFVIKEQISEVYDHRSGYEELWKDSTAHVQIDLVGACATLIWEKIRNNGLESKISKVALDLLYTAIFANTLNFKSSVTTDRDRKAFKGLKELTGLDEGWISRYYSEVERSMLANPVRSIKNDTKIVNFPNLNLDIAIGQIELWDSKNFVAKNQNSIVKTLSGFNVKDWFFTSPSISEGINYIYTESKTVAELLANNLGVSFKGNWGKTDKLWLRKEILRKIFSI